MTKRRKPSSFQVGRRRVYRINPRYASLLRNIAVGYYDTDDDGVYRFHPVRASYDYDPSRVGEKRRRKPKAKARKLRSWSSATESPRQPPAWSIASRRHTPQVPLNVIGMPAQFRAACSNPNKVSNSNACARVSILYSRLR